MKIGLLDFRSREIPPRINLLKYVYWREDQINEDIVQNIVHEKSACY